jgi:glycosyltransferase involved in cell wall biosynthesis
MVGVTDDVSWKPLVSVVTPTLNRATYLGDTIRSVACQTYTSIEHIVVDGASTDDTLEILREAESTYNLRWISEPDIGMYDAVNKGLASATGEVLAYLNSDDAYTPWAVASVVEAFRANSSLDIVYGDGLSIDEGGNQRLAFIPPVVPWALGSTGSLFQPAVFLRRRVFDRHGGFDSSLKYVGDLEYWLRVSRDVTFGRIDDVLAIERVHTDALSSHGHDALAAEDAVIRNRWPSPRALPRSLTRLVAKARAALWRRRLWFRFLRTARRSKPALGGPWVHFIGEGRISISPLRVVLVQIPHFGGRFAWNAVASEREWFGLSSERRRS